LGGAACVLLALFEMLVSRIARSALRPASASSALMTSRLAAPLSIAQSAPRRAPFSTAEREVSSEERFGYNSVDHYQEEDRLQPGQRGDPTNRTFTYFVHGTSAFLYASIARVTVAKFISTMAASADVLAMSSLEVDLAPIQEGTCVTVKWRGKPVFIRYRNAKEIGLAKADDAISASMRHPEKDAERVKEDKWMIVLGVCTHLGCVPIANSGDYSGWFCPCHGSHYDTSGRIRKGPAPLNLEVPEYRFVGPTKVIIG